jgi:hypothetical protein
MIEMFEMLLVTIILGVLGIFLFSKWVEWAMNRMFSSSRLNNQLKRFSEKEKG